MPDLVLFLGDYFTYSYSNEKGSYEIATILNSIKKPVYGVRGNGDSRINLQNFSFPIEPLLFAFENESISIFGSHGDRYSFRDLPACRAGSIYASGHTHVPFLKKRGSLILVNPGSVSRPRSNDGATFSEIDDNFILIRKFDSDKIIGRLNRF